MKAGTAAARTAPPRDGGKSGLAKALKPRPASPGPEGNSAPSNGKVVVENPTFTAEYYASDKRYIGNALQVFFTDGSASERIQVDFPIGHRRRRAEGMPVLVKKFETSVDAHFAPKQAERIKALFAQGSAVDALPVNELMAALITNS